MSYAYRSEKQLGMVFARTIHEQILPIKLTEK